MDDIGIGIDIGASKIVVAACRGGKSEVVLNGEGRRSTQFCVAFNKKERLFGDAAEGQYPVNPENTIYGRDAKQWIGLRKPDIEKKPLTNALKIAGEDKNVKFDVEYRERTQTQIFPEHIFAMLLRKVKSQIEIANNIELSKAVITVPSMFNSFQRFAVKNAVLAAGIEVQAILNDTTATAITYAINQHVTEAKNLLIFDMGASSTDVAVVSVSDESVDVKACGGSLELGGDAFDLRLVQHFVDEFEHDKQIRISDDKQMVARLRVSCEKLKKMLSIKRDANLLISSFYKGEAYRLKMTRKTFEEMCKDFFDKMVTVISDVVVASKLEIHEIVVVGNGGCIPKVEAVISEHFNGKKLTKLLNCDEAAAVGAAHFAAQNLDKEGTIRHVYVSTITSTPLKMQIGDVSCLTLVKRGTILPLNLETPYEDKKNLGIKFFQGDYFLTFFKPKRATLDIHWNSDNDGLISVTTQDIKETQTALLDHQKPNEPKIQHIQALEETFEKYDLEFKRAMQIKDEVEILCLGYRQQVKAFETKGCLNETDCIRIRDICNKTLDWLDSRVFPKINELNEELHFIQTECGSIIEEAKYTSEVKQADKHLLEKNYKEANLLYQHILNTYGKYIDEETRFYLTNQRISALTEMEHYQECLKLSDDLLQNLQDDYNIQAVRGARGRCHFELKNYQECIDDVDFVLKYEDCTELHRLRNEAILIMNKRTVNDMFVEADNLTKSKQYGQSNAVLQELLEKPELGVLADNKIYFKPKIYTMFARNYFQQKDYKEAIEACNLAVKDPDNQVEIWEIRAESYIKEGMFCEAETDIKSLGTVEGVRKGRLNELIRKLEGKRYEAIKDEVDNLKSAKQFQSALNNLDQVKVDNLEKSHKLDYFCNKGFLLCTLKRHDDAVKMFNKALDIDKNYTRAVELRSECCFYLEEDKKVMEIKNEVEKLCFGYRRQVKADETQLFLPENDRKRITDICNETLDWLENTAHLNINDLNKKFQFVQSECDFVITKAKYTFEVEQAEKHLEEKNYKKANSLYMHFLDTYGKYIDEKTRFYLTMQRITALTGMEDFRECIQLSNDLLRNLQDDYNIRKVRSVRAHCHYQLKNYQQCIDEVDFILRYDHSPELHHLRNEAILALNLRTVDDIIAKADKLTKSKLIRGFHDSNWILGELLVSPEFKFLCNNGKDFTAKVYMMRARNHIKLFQYKEAIEACGHAAIDPDNHVEIWEIKAESYLALGKLEEAEKDIASLATVEGFKKGRLNDLMRQLEGKRYDAIKRKHDQFKRDKLYQSALDVLVQVKVDNLEKCHKLDYFCKQAFLLCELYKYDEGVEMCTKALSIDDRYTRAYELRAECYFYSEDKKKAYKDCETALRQSTTNTYRMRELQKYCEEATRKKGLLSRFGNHVFGNDTLGRSTFTSTLEKEFNQLNDNGASSNDVQGYMEPTIRYSNRYSHQ